MPKLNVNIRLDKELKQEASDLANEMGTNLSTIVSMFLVKFTRERRLELDLQNPTNRLEGLTNKEIEEGFYNKEDNSYGPFKGEENTTFLKSMME